MNWSFDELFQLIEVEGLAYFKGSKHGIEKECLRVDPTGWLAKTPHPKALGSALTHPYISTDFSEAQLEFITPAFTHEEDALKFLYQLHAYVYQHIGSEQLWPFSVPGVLPDEVEIPLAEYGMSQRGLEKHIYRKGLTYRYGKKMQTLSGVHYNFSFSPAFLDFLHARYAHLMEKKLFISEMYLKIVRNFLRLGWLNTYLFGATPAADRSYFHKPEPPLKALDPHTLYGPAATSLRMSHLGYYSKIEWQKPISFNSYKEYVEDLAFAVSTPYPPFTKMGLYRRGEQIQLNDHYLQAEAEHYTRIRPKPHLRHRERPLTALTQDGIQYVEVRSIDIDPYSCQGVDVEQLYFLHVFLNLCLIEPSPPLDENESRMMKENQNMTALYGRNPRLQLNYQGRQYSLRHWAQDILTKMEGVAGLLDRAFKCDKYLKTISRQKEKLVSPELLLSDRIMRDLAEGHLSLQQLGCQLGKKCKKAFQKRPLSKSFEQRMTQTAIKSIESQECEEILDDLSLRGYETLETSTQTLIREAKNRGIKVEILDWEDNLIRLTKGKKVEIVKQATRTSKDSLIAFHLMENKHVTKQILKENGLPVPSGGVYAGFDKALNEYGQYSERSIVVKPNLTNYGIGISFISPGDEEGYKSALKEAFQHGGQVIVEEYCRGDEYRFLVIGDRVAAVCQRIPANVVGDGVHTIAELVRQKNHNPLAFRKFSPIKLGAVEKNYLRQFGMTPQSVPMTGERIFLRKNSNVSTGGESIDFTEEGHESYRALACKAAKAVKAAICGVDMIIENIHEPLSHGNPAILELNFNPALYLHRFPAEGKKRHVEKDVLDFLGF